MNGNLNLIYSRHDGRCDGCRQKYKKNDRIWYAKATELSSAVGYHETCKPKQRNGGGGET